jgi:hypothetical protein
MFIMLKNLLSDINNNMPVNSQKNLKKAKNKYNKPKINIFPKVHNIFKEIEVEAQ